MLLYVLLAVFVCRLLACLMLLFVWEAAVFWCLPRQKNGKSFMASSRRRRRHHELVSPFGTLFSFPGKATTTTTATIIIASLQSSSSSSSSSKSSTTVCGCWHFVRVYKLQHWRRQRRRQRWCSWWFCLW